MHASPEITHVLQRVEAGDRQASDELLPLVYDELRRLAAQRLSAESADHTLQPTALVHEAYLRLVDAREPPLQWDSRGHFFAAAAEGMRRILVDHARRKRGPRRGGDLQRVAIEPEQLHDVSPTGDLVALDEALHRLSAKNPRKTRLVELRFFAGLTMPEAAQVLGISLASAERDWAYAKAWLFRELRSDAPDDA